MQQYGGSTLLSACRTAIDSHIIRIHIRILLCRSLDPEFTVWESGILQVLVANLLKLLAAIGSAHRIELDYDETEFGKRSGVPVVRHETLRSIGIARTRIDVFDNRIFLVRIEIGRALDDAPHIGLAISTLCHKHLRSYPSVLLQSSNISRLQGLDELARLRISEHGNRSGIHLRIGIQEIAVIIGILGTMIALFRSERHHILAVDTYFIIMYQIWVLIPIHATSREIDFSLLFIHTLDATNKPFALGNLSDNLRLLHIVEIEMIPVVALAHPEQLLAILDKLTPQTTIVHESIGTLLYHGTQLAGFGIHRQHLIEMMTTLVVLHCHLLAVRCPLHPLQFILVFYLMLVSLHLLSGSHIDDDRIVLWQSIARLGILLLVENRLQLVGRRRFYVVGIAFLYRNTLAYEDVLAVWAPLDAVAVITSDGTILSKDSLGFGIRFSCLMNHHVVTFDVGFHLAVGRKYRISLLLLIYLHPMALVVSAKLRLVGRTRLDAQRLLHRFLRIISLHLILIGIIGYKLPALRSRNLIMQYVGGIAPSR